MTDEMGRLVDQFLILYALASAHRKQIDPQKTRLQKIFYLTERKTFLDDGLAVPGFRFYRYKHGPFSSELDEATHALTRKGLVCEEMSYRISEETCALTQHWAQKLSSFLARPLARIDEVLSETGNLELRELLAKVYALPTKSSEDARFDDIPLSDVPLGVDLLVPRNHRPRQSIIVPEELLIAHSMDLEMTEDERRNSRTFTEESTRKGLDLLGWGNKSASFVHS